jgi:hypothetical protein
VSWIHDTGYAPAFDHEGGVADVLESGTDPSTPPDQVGPRVTGWRSGCQCGWRGTQLYLRSEWPDTEYALAPEMVEQQCRAEWERHLHVVLPMLAIHDLTRRIHRAEDDLREAVSTARTAGVSWAHIGDAAGISRTAAQRRWSTQLHKPSPARATRLVLDDGDA